MLEKQAVDGPSTCVRCGYDLRTIPPDTDCPECGTSVWYSRRGRLLRYADGPWLSRLDRGLRVLRWCRLVPFVVLFAFGATVLLFTPAMSGPRSLWPTLLSFVLIFGAALLTLTWPLWLISAREPRSVADDGVRQPASRILSLGAMPTFIVWGAVGIGFGPSLDLWLRELVNVACLTIIWLHSAAMYREAHRLQSRCEYRRTGFELPMRLVLAVLPIVYIVHWIGPLRLFRTGAWAGPASATLTLTAALAVWFEANGAIARLRLPVGKEMAAAREAHGMEAANRPSTMPSP